MYPDSMFLFIVSAGLASFNRVVCFGSPVHQLKWNIWIGFKPIKYQSKCIYVGSQFNLKPYNIYFQVRFIQTTSNLLLKSNCRGCTVQKLLSHLPNTAWLTKCAKQAQVAILTCSREGSPHAWGSEPTSIDLHSHHELTIKVLISLKSTGLQQLKT